MEVILSVYEPLGEHLKRSGLARIPMTFGEVEAVIGRKLPASARLHRAWWANEERGHSHARAWLRSGYLTAQVDMAGRKLVFARAAAASGAAQKPQGPHPLLGALKGTFTIAADWDLTRPAFDPEARDEMEAQLERTANLLGRGMTREPR